MAIAPANLKSLAPSGPKTIVGAGAQLPYPKAKLLELLSPDDWEGFVEECVWSMKTIYVNSVRLSGSGDMGIDIAGYADNAGLSGTWDNFQCKHYDARLTPGDVWKEMGKIIWYSFAGEYKPPRKYYFIAPRGLGTSLLKLIGDPSRLKTELRAAWPNKCVDKITDTMAIKLEGAFLVYFENFDFTIFSHKSSLDLLDIHIKTPWHTARFGGALPHRPLVPAPPAIIASTESKYIRCLFSAYGQKTTVPVNDSSELAKWPELDMHFKRQRVLFYHAESLLTFARDNTIEGVFDRVQDEVYYGIIDVRNQNYPDGFSRVQAVVSHAGTVAINGDALCGKITVMDKQGVCHQLANNDRLDWITK